MQSRTAAVLASVLLAAVALAAPSAGAPASASPAASGISFVSARSLTPPRGGASQVPPGYLPLHVREFTRAKAAANARAGVHGGAGPASVAGGPTVSPYPNVSPSFDGTFDTGGTPPDTTGAIGPDRYIETVNTKYAIYGRSGSLVNGGTLSALTGISTGLFGYALSDPQMMWDAQTQRFYYSVLYFDSLFFSDNGIAVGWSKTATPSSASDFCQYAISLGSELPDYPKLGDSSSFLLYGFNEFGNAAQTYDGSAFLALNKPAPGSSCAPTSSFQVYTSGVLHNLDGSQAATPVPANLVDDATGTGYVVANADLTTTPSANFVSVYSVTVGATDANGLPVPLVSGPKSVSVPAYAMPASAAQQGSSYLLDTLDGRFEAAVAAVDPAHGGKLAVWTAHAVFGGAGAEERWYELDPSAGSLLQSGVVSDPSLAIWNGAVSPDRANTGTSASFGDSMAMSVSTSSASTYPAIQFVWKQGGGAQSALTNLVQSSGASIDFSCSGAPSCRWGDYSGASPDPAATGSAGTVWLGNQYNLANGTDSTTSWRTWLFAVTPASGAPPPAALAFGSGAQALTAGQPSAAMQVDVSPPQAGDVTVSVSSSSPQGQFATSTGGPWSPTLQVTIPSAQPATTAFFYRDTTAGSATLTASATGAASAIQAETVNAAAVAAITVTPTSATVASGATQPFNASGADQYGNAVSLAGAAWATTVAGGSVSPTTGASTTFGAGAAAGTGAVTASLGGVTGSAVVTVASTPPPRAPTNLVASPVGRHILLTWTGSGTGVTYNVYRGTSAGGESATPYLRGVGDSSVGSGTTYYYRVTAVGAGGESTQSNEAHAKAK
jgi:hypothetical protein